MVFASLWIFEINENFELKHQENDPFRVENTVLVSLSRLNDRSAWNDRNEPDVL